MKMKDLKKQYMVLREDLSNGQLGSMIVWNGARKFCNSLEEAQQLIEKDKKMWSKNNPMAVNGIGIKTEEIKHNFKWHIEWRWISSWEVIE